jgi:hypothetical protein
MFGRLKVIFPLGWIEKSPDKKARAALVVCTCRPREERVAFAVPLVKLRQGKRKSCGCILQESKAAGEQRRALKKAQSRRHGDARTRLWQTWIGIKARCHCPTRKEYRYYGAKGITVYPEWRSSYRAFKAWVVENIGDHPGEGYSIDRIRSGQGYEPGNIRWLSRSENSRRHSRSNWITYAGQRVTLAQAAAMAGLSLSTVQTRRNKGWPEDQWFIPPAPRHQSRQIG